jgi:hypothetical protein
LAPQNQGKRAGFIESEWEGREEREGVGFVFESGLGV